MIWRNIATITVLIGSSDVNDACRLVSAQCVDDEHRVGASRWGLNTLNKHNRGLRKDNQRMGQKEKPTNGTTEQVNIEWTVGVIQENFPESSHRYLDNAPHKVGCSCEECQTYWGEYQRVFEEYFEGKGK